MPRKIPPNELNNLYDLVMLRDDSGDYALSQRQIEEATGMSRQFIRKVATEVGREFPRNGFEVVGLLCICKNCGVYFRKPPSRVERAKNQFCSEVCRSAWQIGENHPQWKTGESVSTFSKWAQNTQEYKNWREKALELAEYTCQVSGKQDEELDVHHIFAKAKHQHLVFDPKNALVVAKSVHRKIHRLIDSGLGFEEAIEEIKNEYGQQ